MKIWRQKNAKAKGHFETYHISGIEEDASFLEMLDILTEDINGEVSEGAEIPVISIGGKFYGDMICTDYKGIENTYYQFKSDDDTVWWILTAKEIGYVPNTDDKYTLYYANNGTVEESRVCDC